MDQIATYLGLLLSVIALWFSIWVYRRTCARLHIEQIHVGLSGSGSIREKNLTMSVSAISVVVSNRGLQSVNRCVGLVIFSRKPSLPLHPTKQGLVSQLETHFSVEPNADQKLVGAWHLSSDGSICGPLIPYEDFVASYLPAKVEIIYGRNRIAKELTVADVRTQFERMQRQMYEMDS